MTDLTHLLEPTLYHNLPTDVLNLNFVVVGAGGTGGYLIPQLVRQISLRNQEHTRRTGLLHTITLYDADVVEEKNLQRQNFIIQDIGKNKAEVMAMRYGRSFQQEVRYVPEYVSDPNRFSTQIYSGLNSNFDKALQAVILIDCTDNNKTRLLMRETADLLQAKTNVVFLSSGNEEKAGQIVCSFKPSIFVKNSTKKTVANWKGLSGLQVLTDRIDTPDFFDIFPNFELDKMPGELSCAEASVSAPQNIYTNMTAANILFGYANKLLSKASISELVIFFDTDSMSQKVYRSKLHDMKGILNLAPNNASFETFIGKHADHDVAVTDSLISAMTWKQALKVSEKNAEKKQKEVEELLASLPVS